ncbi:MAG: hypothetical protein M3Q58_03860 [Bacteroidota bacterium]|nr:hypothetical protein [Bacteroidota bacterium]
MIRNPKYYLLFLLFTQACSFFSSEPEKEPIARVHDEYLYKSELLNVIPSGMSYEDSVAKATSYINNWIRQTLIYNQAEKNLREENKNFNQKLEDYRRSLIIYTYERELIDQILDTLVTLEQIEVYYNQNKQNFELKDNIIKVRYIKVDKNAPDIDKVELWYKSNNKEDLISLENYAYQFAQNFYLDENNWLLFDDLLKEIPIQTYNKEDFLKNNRFVKVEDSESYYFVNIRGFKIKNSISPLNFEMENIRSIIINKRKIQLVNKMKNDIYEEALQSNDIEIFE